MLQVKTKLAMTENYRGTGSWPSWRESSETTIKGVERVMASEADEYENIFDADAPEGSVAYVLSITYNSGDSFGCAHGKHCVLGVFTDKVQAKTAKGIVESCFDEFNDSSDYQFTFKTTDHNGKVTQTTVNNPAAGFFENKTSIDLEGFVIM